MAFLEVTDLKLAYRTDRGLLRAGDGTSFSLEAGEALGVVGESGSRKSSLALALLRLPLGAFTGSLLNGFRRARQPPRALKRILHPIGVLLALSDGGGRFAQPLSQLVDPTGNIVLRGVDDLG